MVLRHLFCKPFWMLLQRLQFSSDIHLSLSWNLQTSLEICNWSKTSMLMTSLKNIWGKTPWSKDSPVNKDQIWNNSTGKERVTTSLSIPWMEVQLLLTILQSEASLLSGQRQRRSWSAKRSERKSMQWFPCSVQEPPHCSTTHLLKKSNK